MSAALSTYKNKTEQLRARLANVSKRAREESETILETGVMVAAGAAFGAADEYWGTDALMGASVPLVAGVTLTAAALLGYGGGMEGTLLAVGRAGLTVEAYRFGARTYREWDTRAPASE